jgi:AcrR family transcriptional regulator
MAVAKSVATHDRICEAAIRVVVRGGLLAMSLDNVAKEAGVSKGGVMYHFATKDKLVEGVVTFFAARVERMLLEQIALDPEPRMRWVRAMLACLSPQLAAGRGARRSEELSPDIQHRFMVAVLAAAANAPQLLEPLRQLGRRLSDRLLADANDGLEQLLLWLAVDGLFLWQFVGLIDEGDPLFAEIATALRQKAGLPPLGGESPKRPARPRASTTRGRRHVR